MLSPVPEGLGPLLSRRYLAGLLGETPSTIADLAERAEIFYAPFNQPKRHDPAKTRRIDNPQDPLKAIQRRIKRRILERVPLPPFIVGGVPGRSATGNAKIHVGRREVVTIDIKDFFPPVKAARVYAMWRQVFRASEFNARLLTSLTTFDDHLPQGSPASNAIANLIALPVACEIRDLCKQRALTFTIYVDDISISGRDAQSVVRLVIDKLHAHGFAVSSRKVKVMPRSMTQSVTGSVVNEHLSNDRRKLAELSRRLIRGLRDGITEGDLRSLEGSVRHAATVNAGQGKRLLRLLAETQKHLAGVPNLVSAP